MGLRAKSKKGVVVERESKERRLRRLMGMEELQTLLEVVVDGGRDGFGGAMEEQVASILAGLFYSLIFDKPLANNIFLGLFSFAFFRTVIL